MNVETFNLDAPPNFRGLNPDVPIRKYMRHLPHWRQEGATYAVTFRLGDSLPKEKIDLLVSMRKHWEAKYPQPRSEVEWREYVKTVTTSVEKWLDQGAGACHFKHIKFVDELARALLHFQHQQYFVSCYAIMPNHCHAVIKPFEGFELEDVLGSIKGVVSKFVNKAIGGSGALWQPECFDRIIRDEEHLFNTIQYFGNNHRNAGIPLENWFRWVCPEWDVVGWGFRDL